ncbi:multisubstrate pseudouridine synthase 7 [Coemansia sp. RSA 1972]|nr:multisubstrate pseudouridine synthase 7 [Coemansia sp. RSA 1972]
MLRGFLKTVQGYPFSHTFIKHFVQSMAAADQPHAESEQGPAKRLKSEGAIDTASPQAQTSTYLREVDAGITEFITPGWTGFDAIIKHRYSDFFVNEIDPHGNVVHLTSYTDADDPEPPKTEAEKEIDALNVPADAQEAFDEAFVRLEPILGAEDAARIKAHLEVTEEQTLDERSLVLNRELDKDQRKGVYMVTNNFLPTRVTCETVGGQLRFIRRLPKDKASDKRGQRSKWGHLGDYCHFVVQKENQDSMDTLQQIARALKCNARVFGMAGTKDKRGITVQKCSAFRIAHERLIWASRKLRGGRLGNFSYAEKEIKLGELGGNQFTIVLRHVRGADAESLGPVLLGIRNTGFVNYFGMQRFGTQSISSHTIGIAVLKSDWRRVVDLILCPRVGERDDVAKARTVWNETKDAKATLELLPRRAALAESSVLQHFVKSGSTNNCSAAFACIPRNLRLMYVHAYQSFVWNNAVSERIRVFGTQQAVPGDLVVVSSEFSDNAHAKSTAPEDSERVAPVLVTEENAHEFSIYDVVLPLPGWDVQYPEHQVKNVYQDIMAKDGLSPSGLAKHPLKEYRLAGAYRHFVIKPRDFSYEWMRYNDDTLPLARSDSDAIEGKHDPESIEFGQKVALKLKFDLPSSAYATMLLRELMRSETAAGYQTQLSNNTESKE